MKNKKTKIILIALAGVIAVAGIGLAVTNEIVNLHGGYLDIDSVEGKGTLVTIQLPIEEIIHTDKQGQ